MQSSALVTRTEKLVAMLKTKLQHKIAGEFEIEMRTRHLHLRQLCLQSAARKLPGEDNDNYRQRHAEQCVDD